MKKCGNCGYQNPDTSRFCSQCGKEIEIPEDRFCPNCGAKRPKNGIFCNMCGAKFDEAESQTAAEPVEPSCAPVKTDARSSASAWISKTKRGIVDFENKHCVIVNTLMIVFAAVFILIALLCPIKMTYSDISPLFANDASEETEFELSVQTVDQSIWKVFGALGYLNLDIDNNADVKKIDEIYSDYNKIINDKKLESELKKWYVRNPDATTEQLFSKAMELMAAELKNINMFAYNLAVTTIGAMDHISGEEIEIDMAYMLDNERYTTIYALVMALIAVFIRLVIVVLSAIFIILAVVGMLRKKNCKLFAYLTSMLILSGVGLCILSIAAMLAPSDALLVVAVMSAIALLVGGLAKAFIDGAPVKHTVKRAVVAALSITAFFLLFGNIINVVTFIEKDLKELSITLHAPLGATLEMLVTANVFISYGATKIYYSYASTVNSIITAALGEVAIALAFIATVRSLRGLVYKADKNFKFDFFALACAIVLLLTAVVPPIVGAADKTPFAYESNLVLMFKYNARAFIYIAMSFMICVFVLGIVLFPKKPEKPIAQASDMPVDTSTDVVAVSSQP